MAIGKYLDNKIRCRKTAKSKFSPVFKCERKWTMKILAWYALFVFASISLLWFFVILLLLIELSNGSIRVRLPFRTNLSRCYELNVCVSQNSYNDILTLWCEPMRRRGLWAWLGYESVMNGISTLIWEQTREFVPSLSLFITMWGYKKKTAICKPGSRSPPDTGSINVLILDFPASRTVRDKYWSHSVFGNLHSSSS